jgi:hypothetical protein
MPSIKNMEITAFIDSKETIEKINKLDNPLSFRISQRGSGKIHSN